MCADTARVPVIFGDDDDNYSDRLLQGGRAKWVDKIWTLDGVPPHEQDHFLLDGTGYALQRWVNGLPEVILKEPGKSLPDPDDLNAEIPKETWPIGKFTGHPEAPWKEVAFAYLLRLPSAAVYTHINSTWGTRICIRELRQRIRNMCRLRGVIVAPIVRLTSVIMPSKKFPGRFRPELEIVKWHLIGNQPAQIEPPKPGGSAGQTCKPVEPVAAKEELSDEIPF
jgi:hypothetical protein